MARKVRWTTTASDDLRDAAAFIERDSHAYAIAFVQRVLEAARSLSNMPDRGRRVPEWGDAAVREVYVMNHRVIYSVASGGVYVLAVLYGTRDIQSYRRFSGERNLEEPHETYRVNQRPKKKPAHLKKSVSALKEARKRRKEKGFDERTFAEAVRWARKGKK